MSVVATLITKVLFEQLLIRTAEKQVEHSWEQSVFFSDDKYVSGALGAIVSM